MCHLVVARIAPGVRVVDLAHGIRGVRAGAVILAQSVPAAPPGSVHLAVVDPGVGTSRRAIVVAAGRGDLLVGPDTGLLVEAAGALGGVRSAYTIGASAYVAAPASATFHGRDVFAPAAAHLALGVEPDELGRPLEGGELVRLPPPLVSVAEGRLEADVVRFDWYGNVQLAAGASDLARASLAADVVVSGAWGSSDARTGRTFADAPPGGLVVYVDSGGHVAIACNGGSARERFHDPERVTISSKV